MGTLRADVDQLEEYAQGYAGPLKIAVAGPWTLAAMMERPRGDRVLADYGARRDLAQSLAEGVAQLIMDLARRLPDITVVLQLDEPLLPAVIAGRIPTASGFSRHRVIDIPEVSGMINQLVERVDRAAGTAVVVHSCAAEVPVGLLHRAGVAGVSLDLDQVATRDWDEIGPALESGVELWLGALPTDRLLGPDEVARRSLTPLRALQIDPEVSARLVVTPACGLASASRESAIASLRAVRRAAAIVTEQLAD
jgi:methionine synthase II (cobalamin-independent)